MHNNKPGGKNKMVDQKSTRLQILKGYDYNKKIDFKMVYIKRRP